MVLWTVIIMSLLIGTFAFEMHVEAKIASMERQRFKAQELAISGFEYAKAILTAPQATEEAMTGTEEVDRFQSAADRLQKGLALNALEYKLPEGSFTVSIIPENSKRNINSLSREEWLLLLDECGVPVTDQEKLIDCYTDWIDEGDTHGLNGAESDDPFYEEQGYSCKNAPIETIEELLLIKNFTKTILYGGITENGDKITGIADKLTVWGDGKVNINSSSREVLMSFYELEETEIDEILDLRNGLDGEADTEDDGFTSLDDIGLGQLSGQFTTQDSALRVITQSKTEDFIYEIQSVVHLQGEEVQVLFWKESFINPDTGVTEAEQKEASVNL